MYDYGVFDIGWMKSESNKCLFFRVFNIVVNVYVFEMGWVYI